MSLLQMHQLPNGWMKDGITWTMEFRGIDILFNGN